MPSRTRKARAKANDPAEKAVATAEATVETGPSNSELLEQLRNGKDEEGENRFDDVLRTAEDIESSGVLQDFAALDTSQVPESEKDRSIGDDALLVMKGFSKMTPEEIVAAKELAYKHPEGQAQVKEALEAGFYGSPDHKQWGALVEELSGGVISAEEAMAMNPSGGMIGPGVTMMRHLASMDSLKRHAMRHDATGFLLNRFGVGPGYATKTTMFGLKSDNPFSGQLLGWARELFGDASDFKDGSQVASGSRYGGQTEPAEPTGSGDV